ncbi:hypothetical protein N39L_60190 [Limnospira platensis NIES-39]|uniref:Uncharacterized protein n=1 Tax=Limnospira platensis NIES-46 TaxID=1236695 RepID=A0A5M3TFQ2_LIMPL|nr:hypothetical protein N39L_60190 [Arthrospira platensis NIES-39]GCE96888.1 hypothetical protein NIES46_49630 [Arthrospira platensis NIES-46]
MHYFKRVMPLQGYLIRYLVRQFISSPVLIGVAWSDAPYKVI